MKYIGQFTNRKGATVEITLSTADGGAAAVSMDDGTGGIWLLADDTVETECSQQDTMDHVLQKTATIRILSTDFRDALFARSVFDIEATARVDGQTVFHGWLTPQTYSQSFVERTDEIELNCVDVLAALEYRNYMDVGAAGVDYATVKASAATRSMLDILSSTIAAARQGMQTRARIWYDGSRALSPDEADRFSIFAQLEISELLFLGDDEDSVWTSLKVVEEMMRYLGLHITQEGDDFYIFSWQTMRLDTEAIEWADIATGERKTIQRPALTLSTENIEDNACDLSVGECFNVVSLTCSVEKQKSVVENPIDDDSLTRPFGGRQKYMTEYSSDGEGVTAWKAFRAMIQGGDYTYGGASITDWLLEVKDNPKWRFCAGGTELLTDLCADGKNQQFIPNCLSGTMGAAIMATGKIERKFDGKDDSVTASVSMDDALVISVNGTADDTEAAADAMGERIKAAMPVAEYTGDQAGGVFSPSDDTVTNYIVVSGDITLNPLMNMTDTYKNLHDGDWGSGVNRKWWHKTVPSRTNGDGRYYTRQYFKAASRRDSAEYDDSPSYTDAGGKSHAVAGWFPFTDQGPQQYEFKYSAVGDSTDKISKLGVVACQLIIGDKCVVEKPYGEDLGTGTPGTGKGEPSDYVWMDYKEREQCQSDDEYWQQCFTIGFNPKVGDNLVGKKYQIMSNASYELDIDQEGIAIPVRAADRVRGKVTFRVLGPYNLLWNEITRRHPTMFRHTKWSSGSIPLMQHVSSIIISKLEVKVCSDNGRLSVSDEDNDLVYMSDTATGFMNKKDDLEFKLTSALTADEAELLGVETATAMSTPVDRRTGTGLLALYDRALNATAKPEQLYVDEVYREYSVPRITMEVNMQDAAASLLWQFATLRHPALGKDFQVVGVSRNLMDGSAKLITKNLK